MSGFQKVPKPKSILTQEEGMVTIRALGRPGRINSRNNVMVILNDVMGEIATSRAGSIELISDDDSQMTGALIDLPVDIAVQFLQTAAQPNNKISGLVFDRPPHLTLSQCLSQSEGLNRNYKSRFQRTRLVKICKNILIFFI